MIVQPCVCVTCRTHFARGGDVTLWGMLGVLVAPVCEDCGHYLCPACRSHDIADVTDDVIAVPPEYAATMRASVWGRGH